MSNNVVRNQVMQSVGNMKSYERERITRQIKYDSYVTGYALGQAGYGLLIGLCGAAAFFVGRGLWLYISYPVATVAIFSLMLGGFVAGVAGMYSLFVSKREFAHHMTEYEGAQFEAPQVANTQQNAVRWDGETRDKEREGKVVGGIKFTGKNLDDLYLWYEEGIDSIRRDPHGDKPGFKDLTHPFNNATFHAAREVLIEKKFIEKNNKWTALGVEFIKDE